MCMGRTVAGYCSMTDSTVRARSASVAAQASNEANVVRVVDKDFDVQLLEQSRVDKDQDAFDDNYQAWLRRRAFHSSACAF